MTNAIRDNNFVVAGLAVLNTDTTQGENLVRVKAEASTGALFVNADDTISFTMEPIDPRDENYRGCLTWTGSDGQVYPWVANSDGEVLVDIA